MKCSISKIRLNKNKSENSGKKVNNKKRLTSSLVTLALISMLISAPVTFFSATASAAELTLPSILTHFGFNNIALVDVQTFSPGMYNVTLMAEVAGYHTQNVLSYYAVGASDLPTTIFTGPEGRIGVTGGYVEPPVSKYFESNTQFGLSMLAPEHIYFTEHYLNPDYPEEHAQVYANLDVPGMFLIGFENQYGGIDRDYNDMVFSMVPVHPPQIVSVIRDPVNPTYDLSVTTTAIVDSGSADIASVVLSYQIGSASWIDVTMSLDGGFYVADIPAQPYATTVNYQVSATDTIGFSAVSAIYSYTVGDSVPPVISGVQVSSYPRPNQPVKISATLTEPAEASGVKNGALWYTANTVWSSLEMTLQGGSWTAIIPGQSEGTPVEYYIKAFDNAGNSATTSIASYTPVPNTAPVANFSASPSTVFTGEVIKFDGSASYDYEGYIASYAWNFGDGTTGSGVTASHSYVDNGEYSVSLTVTDSEGGKGLKMRSVTVKNRPPVADLAVSATILDKQETVTFDASGSHDPDGTIVSYSWAFGDGNTATGVSVSYSYPNVGAYTVILTVTDNDGAKDTASVLKIVGNQSPVAVIAETAETAYVGDTVTFNAAESYDADGYVATYAWDFGDGTTATGITVSHAYATKGSYVVTLTVADNDGATDSVEATKTVMNKQPVALFTKTAETANVDEAITFDASASHDSDGTIVSYSWAFGDGATATGVSVQHAYSEYGTYTVSLTVTDDEGATDTTSATINIQNRAPVASFTESAETVSSGESIHFDASASYDTDGTIAAYAWDFGDGTTATGVTVDHAYENKGVYTVTLTVTDDEGATGSAIATKNVVNSSPVALFTEDAATVAQNVAIHFDASESYDIDGTIASYVWDFGDGTTGTGVTTMHAYSEAGTYTVTLTVTDNDGASTSAVSEKTVETQDAVTLAVLSVIGLGVTALTATFLYGLFIRRRKKKNNNY